MNQPGVGYRGIPENEFRQARFAGKAGHRLIVELRITYVEMAEFRKRPSVLPVTAVRLT